MGVWYNLRTGRFDYCSLNPEAKSSEFKESRDNDENGIEEGHILYPNSGFVSLPSDESKRRKP